MGLSNTAIAVTVKLVVGGLQYVVTKLCLDWEVQGMGDKPEKFKKDGFLTAVTFLSMLLLILPFFIKELTNHRAKQREAGLVATHPYSLRDYGLTLMPAVLDVVAVAMSMKANKSLNATVMILLKSTRIIVTAFLTRFVLRKPQQLYQWFGVFVTIVGLLPVCLANYFREGENEDKKEKQSMDFTLALSIVLVAEILRGIRYVYEERLMKINKLSAEFVVFMESLVGFIFSVIFMIGAHFWIIEGKESNYGRLENMEDTFTMLGNSWSLWLLIIAHFSLVGIANYSTTLVSKYLSSTLNAIISQARTVVVWLPMILLSNLGPKKADGHGKYGEPLDRWSTLEILGFIFLAISTFVYSGKLKLPLPWCYPEDELANKEEAAKEDKSPSTSHDEKKQPLEEQI